MTRKRFTLTFDDRIVDNLTNVTHDVHSGYDVAMDLSGLLNELSEENEQLKEGMIGVVDRYIKNVECNPPSSARTYLKIKNALINIREDLRDLIGDVE